MERIQINGEWFVKESDIKGILNVEDELDLVPTHTESLIVESSNFCFDASVCYRANDEGFYDQIDIVLTDKRASRRQDWKTEHWDSMEWFKGIYENDPDSIKMAKESLDDEGLKVFRHLIKHLVKREWLVI
jgi:hypothetical protein